MKIRKISHKIIIFNTIGILLCTIIIGLVTWFFLIDEYIEEENAELSNISNGVSETLKTVPYEQAYKTYQNLEFGDKDWISIIMTYPDGKSVEMGLDHISFSDFPKKNWIIKKKYALHFYEKKVDNIKFTFIRKYSYNEIIKITRIIFYLFILLAVSIIVISYFVSKNILKPVTYIINESKDINEKNLDIKLPKIRDDEIGDLIDIINNIFSKMQEILQNQKNFSSNVSHELKTPIAIMKGYLDILKWGKNDPKMLDEALESMNIEIVNMEKIISNLQFISQAKKLKILNEQINLCSLLNKIKNDYSLLKIEKSIIVKCDSGETIYGDRHLIFEALRGLIDNSIKYSNGDSIFLIIEDSDKWIKVIIRDFGPGIPEEDTEKIFERYYQIGTQNYSHTRGTGLGLSIIKEIIELHNAEIKIKNRSDGLDTELIFKK